MIAAGVLSFSDAIRLIQLRGSLMSKMQKGSMVALKGVTLQEVERLCAKAVQPDGVLVPANLNSPEQIVISGDDNSIEAAILCAFENNLKAIPLPVSGAFHSPLMQEAAQEFADEIRNVQFRNATIPVISNVTAQPVINGYEWANLLKQQMTSAVLWEASIRYIHQQGIEIFVEIGPGQILSKLISKIVPSALILNVEDINSLQTTVDQMKEVFTHVSVNNSDVVIDWNATALNAVQNTRKFAPIAARDLAIVHAAIYDAVNAIDRSYDPYLVSVEESVAEGASLEAAAAAYTALVDLFPTQTAEFDLQFKRSLAEIPDDAAKLKGIELGTYVAEEILEIRSTDGADIYSGGFYEPGTEAGEWRPTPPNYLPAGFSEWGKVTPFVIPSVDDYLGEGFPELTSEQYAAEINETKALGSVDSTLRTDDQTEIAKFWSFDRIDSFGVTGFWNQIAEEIAIQQDNTLVENARLFALLNFGQADSGIAVLASKYNFGLWCCLVRLKQITQSVDCDRLR